MSEERPETCEKCGAPVVWCTCTLVDDAIGVARLVGFVTISMLARRLRIGVSTAAGLIQTMQDRGIISAEFDTEERGFVVLDWGN